MTPAKRKALVLDHLELVKAIAGSLLRNFPPCIEFDDLVQEGNLGLMRAAELYDDTRGVTFKAYAKTRIRGAIIDANRRRHYRNSTHAPLEDAPEQWRNPEYDDWIDRGRRKRALTNVVEMLSPQERTVVVRCFAQQQTAAEIGQVLSMSAPRVGQVRRSALRNLKRDLAMRGIAKAA